MWPFSKRSRLAESGVFDGFTDCHCHILPGVDDGVETMEVALAILSRYERLGVREVWLTPHIMEEMPNSTALLRGRFARLRDAYRGPVALHLSAENMLDALFAERLREGDLLPWGADGGRLLVETSFFNAPSNFRDTLRGVRERGYTPVLAHPERYLYMELEDLRAMRRGGVELQLNLFSLLGMYGRRAEDTARRLLREELYSHAATDLHSLDALEDALRGKLGAETIQKVKEITDKKK